MALLLRLNGGVAGRLQQGSASALLGLDPHFDLFLRGLRYESATTLPELYLRYRSGDTRLSLGRFYLPIGIHDYSELYYVGFIFVPLVKSYAVRDYASYRPVSGLLWEDGRGPWSWEFALTGQDESGVTLGLRRPRGVAGRVQAMIGRLILGLNAYTVDEESPDAPAGGPGPYVPHALYREDAAHESMSRVVHWYGLDGRFSLPQWVFRAEAFRGSVEGSPLRAHYLDILYHPAALPRWTFLGRLEGLRAYGHHSRYTVGVRRVLGRGLALSVNWIDDRVRFASDAGGLNIQLQRTFQY